jgi:hypothetical protein
VLAQLRGRCIDELAHLHAPPYRKGRHATSGSWSVGSCELDRPCEQRHNCGLGCERAKVGIMVPSVCEIGQVSSEGTRVMSLGGDDPAPAMVVAGGGGDHSWKLLSRDSNAD